MEQNVCTYMACLAGEMRQAGKDSKADLFRAVSIPSPATSVRSSPSLSPSTATTYPSPSPASATGKTGNKEIVCWQMVEAMMEAMGEELDKREEITLQGFGSFRPWPQSLRIGRNPRTGAACLIAPRISIRFKAGKDLLKKLNK